MATSIPTPPSTQPPPTQQPARKSRKTTAYTEEEFEIIIEYKKEYLETTSHSERENLLRTGLLVKLHNYWLMKEGGDVRISDGEFEKRNKDLLHWIRNNWRATRRVGADPPRKRISRILMVWREMKDEVQELMEQTLAEEGGTGRMDSKTQLRLWPPAAKEVYRRLNKVGKEKIDNAIERAANEGNPPEIQQKRAARRGGAKVEQWAAERWKDMGMVTLVVYAYQTKDHRVAVGIHDQTELTTPGRPSFAAKHSNLLDQVQIKLFDYLTASSTPLPPNPPPVPNPSDPTPPASNQTPPKDHIHLEIEENGFPKMPAVVDTPELKKDYMVALVRRYLTVQYALASGGRKRQVPFKMVNARQHDFIEAKYRPRGMELKDPHNMTKDGLVALCQHIFKRQTDHGPADAFRFRKYHTGKGDDMAAADYGTRANEDQATRRALKGKKARAAGDKERTKKARGKQAAAADTQDRSDSDARGKQAAAADTQDRSDSDDPRPIDSPRVPLIQEGSAALATEDPSNPAHPPGAINNPRPRLIRKHPAALPAKNPLTSITDPVHPPTAFDRPRPRPIQKPPTAPATIRTEDPLTPPPTAVTDPPLAPASSGSNPVLPQTGIHRLEPPARPNQANDSRILRSHSDQPKTSTNIGPKRSQRLSRGLNRK